MANPRHTRLAPVVEDDMRIRAVDDTRQLPTFEEKMLRDRIRRERAGAYWFAATKWGIVGIIFGILIGAGVMYAASIATVPMYQDAMARWEAINSAQKQLEEGAGISQENTKQLPQPPNR
ncbi:MAG: hypothetical protein JNJ73_07560 [Hyphomonadaceae bacterium]|nr:hypothetical protein [Hyphomonadaceae bacterium]